MSNLLQLKNGIKNYGIRSIFSGASFAINEGEKIGVIGPNGAGKSTLFKILVGAEDMDSGDITRMSGLRLGYLAQDEHWGTAATVEEFLSSQMTTPIWDLKRMAPSFGLDLAHFSREIRSLSGGYRMRIKLLHLLASQPDLMLLDEPTNYLDLETLVVLESFLQNTNRAFMLISHDREFLRRTTDHILEIEAGQMTKYSGNIDDYFEQKALLREQLEKQALTAQAKRKEVLDFAARFGASATKARQVQSRLKGLERMETIELRNLPTTAKIRLPEPARTGKTVISTRDVQLGYGEKVVLRSLSLELNKGDHLGIVGVNGAGKSTLLKALAGELAPISGDFEFGMGVEIGYFAQHVAERLDPKDSVLEAMGAFAHSDISRQEILDLAGCLLFGGDDVHKKISVLSGGEKSRVALGQILLKRASCLLLDEPTNHLDFDTVEAMTQALMKYTGSVVIVSHDRGFVRRTATKILEIKDGRAEFYPGTYDEYVWSVQRGALADRRAETNAVSGVVAQGMSTSGPSSAAGLKAQNTPEARAERTLPYGPSSGSSRESSRESSRADLPRVNFKERKKSLEKELRSSEREMQQLDTQTESTKAEILDITARLMQVSGLAAAELARELGRLQAQNETREARYLELMENHEAAEREIALMENRRTD